MNWQTVSIFISSTFKDMHSERDILVKKVFPELRERLLPYRIQLVDIDLRWGITEEQSENDKTIDFCLESIEDCRPFFLAILGERYGWIPGHDLRDLNQRFPGLELTERASITAMEIIHAVMSHNNTGDQKNPKGLFSRLISSKTATTKSNALFFFRDPTFENEMPKELLDIVKVESPEHYEKLKNLKDKIRHLSSIRKPIENYPCHYKGLSIDWDLIEEDAPENLRKAMGSVIHNNVILAEDFTQLPADAKQWLQGKSRILLDGMEEFAQLVRDELWSMLQNEFPELHKDAIAVDDLDLLEDDEHLRYKDEITHLFVGRENLLKEAKETLATAQTPIVITGSSGSGKSALLAKLAEQWEKEHPDGYSIVHFPGASILPNHSEVLLKRFIRLLSSMNSQSITSELEPAMIPSVLHKLLQKIDPGKNILLVIDDLEHLYKNEGLDLRWVPEILPEHISIVLGFGEDQPHSNQYFKQLTQLKARFLQIPLLRKEERMTLIRQLPALSAKTMDRRHIQQLSEHPASNLPLFLSIALEELRMFASFEQLEKRIHRFPQQTGKEGLELLYQQVLQRLEKEIGEKAVSEPLSLLCCSSMGLKEMEIQSLCPEISKDQLALLWRELRSHIQNKNGLLNFSHHTLKEAVEKKYLDSFELKNHYHSQLAEFFIDLPDKKRSLPELLEHYHFCGKTDLMQSLLFKLENFLVLRKENPQQLSFWWDRTGIQEPLDLLHESLCHQLEAYDEILDNDQGINLGFWAPVSESNEIILYNESQDNNIKPILEAWQHEVLIELVRLSNQFNINSSASQSIRLKALAIFNLELNPVHARSLEALASVLPFIFQQLDKEDGKQYASKVLLTSVTYLPSKHPVNISLRMHIHQFLMASDPSVDYKSYYQELMEAFDNDNPCDEVREDPRDLQIRAQQLIHQKALVLTSYSQTLRLKGEIEEAERYCEQALSFTEKELGPLHELTIQALNNLAMLRMENRGDFESGEKILKETLERADARIGKYSSLGLALINNLSASYGNSGRYEEGLVYYREALERKQIVLGELNASTLHSRYNLAFCLSQLGNYQDAIRECKAAYNGFSQTGKSNEAILMQVHLSNMLQDADQMDESMEVFHKAQQQFYDLEENRQQWTTYYLLSTRLADIYEAQNKMDEAWEVYWEQLEKLKNTEAAQNHLMALFNKMKQKLKDQLQLDNQHHKTELAIEVIKKLIHLHLTLFEETHPDVLHWKFEFCEALIKLKQYEEAEPVLREVVMQMEKVHGIQSPETRIAMTQLSSLLSKTDKEEEAGDILMASIKAGSKRKLDTESICKEIIKEKEKEFGEEHPNTLNALDEVAQELMKENKVEPAIEYMKLAFERSEKAYGPLAEETLKRAQQMGQLLWRTENYTEAEPLFRRIALSFEKSKGLSSHETLVALDDLAKILGHMEENAEAIKILEKGLTGKKSLYGPTGLLTLESHNNLIKLYERIEDKESYTHHLTELHGALNILGQPEAMKALAERYVNEATTALHDRIERHVMVIEQMQSEGKAEYLGHGEEEVRATATGMAERDMDLQHPDGTKEIEQCLDILKQLQPYQQASDIWLNFCTRFEEFIEEGDLVQYMPRYYFAHWLIEWGNFTEALQHLQKVLVEGNLNSHHAQVAGQVYINLLADEIDPDSMWELTTQMISDLLKNVDPDYPALQFFKQQVAAFFMIHRDFSRAAQLYSEILEQVPTKVQVFRFEIQASLGEAWAGMGEIEKGVVACSEAWSFFSQDSEKMNYFGHVACHLANVFELNNDLENAKKLWGLAVHNANNLLNYAYQNQEYEELINQHLKLINLAKAAESLEAFPTLINVLTVTSLVHKRLGHYSLMNSNLWNILGHLSDIENQEETFNFVVRTWQETQQHEMLEKLKEINEEN